MSLDNQDKIESLVATKTYKRRKFLKRASAGVVVSSLPTQSVWGYECTVSGAMSGNLSGVAHHKECDVPQLPAGRSPGSWKQFITTKVDEHASMDKLHAMFSYVGHHYSDKHDGESSVKAGKRRCIISEVKAVAGHTMNINSSLLTSGFETNISAALSSSGGLDYNVAAIWLNIYFGMGGTPQGGLTADNIIEQFLSYLVIKGNAYETLPDENTLFNFDDDAISSYTPKTCSVIASTTPPVEPEPDKKKKRK